MKPFKTFSQQNTSLIDQYYIEERARENANKKTEKRIFKNKQKTVTHGKNN
jgi:hypothetical protein